MREEKDVTEEEQGPRIVESGPIHIKVDLLQAIQSFIPPEALEAFVKEWLVKSLSAQATEQGEQQDG